MKVKASRFVSSLSVALKKIWQIFSRRSAVWKYIPKISNALFVMLAIVLDL